MTSKTDPSQGVGGDDGRRHQGTRLTRSAASNRTNKRRARRYLYSMCSPINGPDRNRMPKTVPAWCKSRQVVMAQSGSEYSRAGSAGRNCPRVLRGGLAPLRPSGRRETDATRGPNLEAERAGPPTIPEGGRKTDAPPEMPLNQNVGRATRFLRRRTSRNDGEAGGRG